MNRQKKNADKKRYELFSNKIYLQSLLRDNLNS